MAAGAWKGNLSFGLVTIPIVLYPAARKEGIHLHQLHKKCHSRVRQPLFCPTCNRIVQRSEIVKGYEYEKDRYVLIEDEEIKKIAAAASRTMEILEFVDVEEVDPIYFDASYLVVPGESANKPYRLLLKGMEETGRAAIAKVVMHQREYLAIVRPRAGGLTLHTMYFQDEIRSVSEYGKDEQTKTRPEEMKLVKQLIESLEAHFDPRQFHDDYQERIKKLLEAKQKGEEIATEPERKLAPVLDMMEALKKSLAARQVNATEAKSTQSAKVRKMQRKAS